MKPFAICFMNIIPWGPFLNVIYNPIVDFHKECNILATKNIKRMKNLRDAWRIVKKCIVTTFTEWNEQLTSHWIEYANKNEHQITLRNKNFVILDKIRFCEKYHEYVQHRFNNLFKFLYLGILITNWLCDFLNRQILLV